MKLKLYLILLIAISIAILCACSPETQNPSNNSEETGLLTRDVIGTWTMQSYTGYFDTTAIDVADQHKQLTFNLDGSFSGYLALSLFNPTVDNVLYLKTGDASNFNDTLRLKYETYGEDDFLFLVEGKQLKLIYLEDWGILGISDSLNLYRDSLNMGVVCYTKD